jgi:chemotaxis protein CheX
MRNISLNVEYINPFITSTLNAFDKMLSCKLTRVGLCVKNNLQPDFDVSGIIGLSGRAAGTVIVSLSREMALSAAAHLLGEPQLEINSDVLDIIGELTNLIAGGAKTQLSELRMSMSLPSVIIGKDHIIYCNSGARPISILFESSMGAVHIDVSLVEQPELAVAT